MIIDIYLNILVSSQCSANILFISIMSNKLRPCWDIYSIHITVSDRWSCTSEVHLLSTRIPSHLDEFIGSRATHDRVIYNKHDLVQEFTGVGKRCIVVGIDYSDDKGYLVL